MTKNIRTSRKPRPTKKILLALLVVLLLVGGGFGIYQAVKPKPIRQADPKPTITSLPSKTNSTTPEKSVSTPTGTNQGTATSAAQPTITSSPSTWHTSQSGVIVLQKPLENEVLSAGTIVSGTASIDQIQYRIIDDTAGVISQGPITVSNGKYSVSVNFKPTATTGRLDVFSTDGSGKEINEIQLKVNLK